MKLIIHHKLPVVGVILLGSVLPAMMTFHLAAYASVTLTSFAAEPDGNTVYVSWETAAEIDTAGFYVDRSLRATDSYTHVSGFVPSEGNSLTGAFYDFTDQNVQAGVIYYYKLEVVNTDNSVNFYGPVSATLQLNSKLYLPAVLRVH